MEQKKTPGQKLWTATQWPLYLVLIMWAIRILESLTPLSFGTFGILPRKIIGLKGILFGPMVHGSIGHVASNSFPFLVGAVVIMFFYKRIAVAAIAMIWLMTGFLVWIFAKPAFHIGASGVVYGMVSFIFWAGVFNKDRKSIVLALIMLFLYGGMFIGILPDKPGVSWESHLIGGLVGILTAYVFRIPKEKDPWEEEDSEPTMKYFNEDTFSNAKNWQNPGSGKSGDYWTSHRS